MRAAHAPHTTPPAGRFRRLLLAGLALTAPGLLLGITACTAIWAQRAISHPTRWGWAALGTTAFLLIAPHTGVLFPWSLVAGAAPGACLGSAVSQLFLGPLLALLWSPLPPTPAAPAVIAEPPAQLPSPTDGSIMLGRDATARAVTVDLTGEAMITVVGQPGTGKTVDLVHLIAQALGLGWSVLVLDLKAGGLLRDAVAPLADRAGVPFARFDPDDPTSLAFNPCLGAADRIANALIGSFSYEGIADVYGQIGLVAVTTIVATLQAIGKPVTLAGIVAAFEKTGRNELHTWLRAHPPADTEAAKLWFDYMTTLIESGKEARVITEGHVGIQKRLAALTQGGFGPLLRAEQAIDLEAALRSPALTYFGLSALARPADVGLLGTVILQQLKQVVATRHRQHTRVPCLLVIDETPALGDPHQLNDLLLQAREGGITVVASSQYLPDDPALRSTLLGAGVVIAHRVAAPDAAALAEQFGTTETIEVAPQLDYETGRVTRASLRQTRTFTVSPDRLRDLRRGQAAVRLVHTPTGARHHIVQMHYERIDS